MLGELRDIPCAVKIGTLKISGAGFADDISVMSTSLFTLQHLTDVCVNHSRKWRYEFGPSKIQLIIYGGQGGQLVINNHVIYNVEGANHLGVPLCSTKHAEKIATDARIQIHKKISYMIQGICARNGGINPMSASKVYLSVEIPRLLYGCQVWPISDDNVELMERAHQDAARRLQGLPQQCAGPAATVLMGWLSVQATIDMYRLIYPWTLLRIPNLFKKNLSNLLIETFHMPNSKRNKTGPLSKIVKTCHKYNIQEKVLSLLILNPNHISREQWKKIVKNVIWSQYRNNWYMQCILFKSLSMFVKSVNNVAMSWMWRLCRDRPQSIRKCKCTGRLVVSSVNYYIMYTKSSKLCQLCSMYSRLCHEHVLFECPALVNERVKRWTRVIESMPAALISSIDCMNTSEKLVFILSGLNCEYVSEWRDIYEEIANFIFYMNHEFRQLAVTIDNNT